MVFTSYTYVVFLALAFLLNWTIPPNWRKPFLIAASYIFYCTWKWEFGFLLLGVSVFNWAYGRWVLASKPSNALLTVGILLNLLPLVYFKYTNFLLQSLSSVAGLFHSNLTLTELDIVLPLGISFFTFQGVAYLFDVATGEQPFCSVLDFLLFKSFWPQLIAGPIVRVDEMRPQIEGRPRLTYEDFAFGCQRIVFGFFKKVVLADTLAPVVDSIFLSKASPNGLDAAAAILGFGLQIYFDFSAYSDIAIGSARLLGFRLPENFNWPYMSQSPQQFWNRWHMTLSRWIRDYLFTPLSMVTRRAPHFAPAWLLLAMAICGLWHGARWTFVVWGIWHGFLLVVNQTVMKGFFTPPAGAERRTTIHGLITSAVTFCLITLGWVFFRAQSMTQAIDLLRALAIIRGGIRPAVLRENDILVVALIFALLLGAQLLHRPIAALLDQARVRPALPVLKPIAYAMACALVVAFDHEARAFVYFQF